MLLQIRKVLSSEELVQAREILRTAPWEDGRLTAGEQSAQAKNNQQLREDCDATRDLYAQVNVTNVTNKLYGDQLYPGFAITGVPRTFLFTVGARF